MQILTIILSFFILLGSSILGTVLPYREGNSLWTIFSILWLLAEPSKFFYRTKYQKIISSWYFYLLVIFEVVILFFMFFRTELSFWMIYISTFILIILAIFTQKENYIRTLNISKLLLFMIGIMAFSTYFSTINFSFLSVPLGISLSIFSFILIFVIDTLVEKQNLQFIFFILMLFAIISKQPICVILFIRLFLDSDHF